MARKSLASVVADELLDRIVAGEFPPGSLVPGELELSARHDVSRMTVREAMKTLAAQQILSVQRGRGTFVLPVRAWESMEAVLRAASAGINPSAAAMQLIELRRMLEAGSCALAAIRISPDELERLRHEILAMRTAHQRNDVADFVAADLAFHDVILRAADNVFVAALFEPLHRLLEKHRAQTSRVSLIQEHAIQRHEEILLALESGEPERSRAAMDAHMAQTLLDLKTHVLHDQL